MKEKSLTVASIIVAIAASLCCIGPVVAVALGLGAFGLATAFESVRPYLLGLTFVILAVAFYRAYRLRPDENCATEVCAKPVSRRAQVLFLWLGAAMVVLFAAFPNYSGVLWNTFGPRFQTAAASTAAAGETSLAVITVDDLNCGGCVAAIQHTLSRLDGVLDVRFNYDDNTADVTFDGRRVTAQQIGAKVKAAGVNVLAVRSNG